MADTPEVPVAETSWVRIYVRNDEIHIEQKDGIVDCPKVRFRAREGSIGAFTGDAWIDGQWRELINVKYARASAEGGSPRAGHIRLMLNDGQAGDDSNMRNVVDFFHDRVKLHVPIEAPNLLGFGTKIALRAQANGKAVCAEAAGSQPLIANRDVAKGWETFTVERPR